MLVKKGQNIKIINLHDKTVIYTSRFVYIHQDSYIYIKIRTYTSRFVYIQQDLYKNIKICIYTLRFVLFGHKGEHDRWIDYRVFKRRSNEEAIFSLLRRVYRAMTEEMTPASNAEEDLLISPWKSKGKKKEKVKLLQHEVFVFGHSSMYCQVKHVAVLVVY